MIYDQKDGGDAYNLRGLENVVRQTAKALREHIDEFDSIAVTGMSGALVGAPVALRLRKPLVVIRKPGDGSHAQKFRGEGQAHINVDKAGRRVLFLDDFVNSGASRRRVRDALLPEGARVVAQYTYREHFDPAGWKRIDRAGYAR